MQDIPEEHPIQAADKDGMINITATFHPTKNDGYALIDNVSTTKGKVLLHEMNVLFPEGSVSAILGPSGAGKSTLLNVLTNSLSMNSKAVADSKLLSCILICDISAKVAHANVLP